MAGGIVEDVIDIFDFVTILVFVGSAYPRYSAWVYDLAHTIASIFRSGFSWI